MHVSVQSCFITCEDTWCFHSGKSGAETQLQNLAIPVLSCSACSRDKHVCSYFFLLDKWWWFAQCLQPNKDTLSGTICCTRNGSTWLYNKNFWMRFKKTVCVWFAFHCFEASVSFWTVASGPHAQDKGGVRVAHGEWGGCWVLVIREQGSKGNDQWRMCGVALDHDTKAMDFGRLTCRHIGYKAFLTCSMPKWTKKNWMDLTYFWFK